MAVLCHAVLLAALVRLSVQKMPAAPDPSGFAVIMSPVAPGTAPATRRPTLAPPAVPTLAPPAIPAPALPAPDLPRLAFPVPAFAVAAPHAVRMAAARARPAAPAQSAAAAPAQASGLAVAAADKGAALAALKLRIDQAVKLAAAMPEAAMRQRREGRAQVRFNYLDGAIEDIALLQSSDSRLLDDAALRAVRGAAYPAAPAALRGRKLALQIWIEFRLART